MSAVTRKRDTAEDAGYAALLVEANVNPATGLSTDYLNHFNEAIMLLEMIPVMPECADDLAAWRPLTYQEHFAASHLRHRALIVKAYEAADSLRRDLFDTVCGAMNRIVLAAQEVIRPDIPSEAAAPVATEAATRLKSLEGQASAVIHGVADAASGPASLQEAQHAIDAIFAHEAAEGRRPVAESAGRP